MSTPPTTPGVPIDDGPATAVVRDPSALVADVPLTEVMWVRDEIAFRRHVFESIQALQSEFPAARRSALRASASTDPRRAHAVVAPQIAGVMPPALVEAGHRAAVRMLGVLNQMRQASRAIGLHLDPAADEVRLLDRVLHIQESYPPEVRAEMASGTRDHAVLTAAVAGIWASCVHPDVVFVLRARHTHVELGLSRLVQRHDLRPQQRRPLPWSAGPWAARLAELERDQAAQDAVVDDLVDHVRRLYDVLVRVGREAAGDEDHGGADDPNLRAVGRLLAGLSDDAEVAPGHTTSRDLFAALERLSGPEPGGA